MKAQLFELVLFQLSVVSISATSNTSTIVPDRTIGKCSEGYYGYNCRHHCHCADPGHCDVIADCHGKCADGWAGPSCQSQNLAFGMPTQIRSRDPDVSSRSRSTVDGDSGTCVTSDPDRAGWLRVDLQTSTEVYLVSLVTPEGSAARGWQILVTKDSSFYWATPCATVRSNLRHVTMSCDTPTTGRYVTIRNTKGPVSVCEVQINVCADYSFGAECNETCQCADASERCHPLIGQCSTGCRLGFSGQDCQEPCRMTYGPNCATACGWCQGGVACDPLAGACPADCQPGWKRDKCHQRCDAGLYGQDCAVPCGGCQDNATCASDTGFCPDGCQAGLQGHRCDQECPSGRHGPSCRLHCGQCRPDSTCTPENGVCPQGCAAGWEGLFCTQECLPLYFGVGCTRQCRQCMTSCDKVSGQCDVDGCVAGKTGNMCEQDCRTGFYGPSCREPCGKCEKGSCDIISGDCPLEWCVPGWEGVGCDAPCEERSFGVNCSEACGSCQGGDICDSVTGVCPGDCAEGFHGDQCKTLAIFVDTTSDTSITLIGSVLSIALFVVVVLCVCLVFKWRREHIYVKATCA